ncbi:hypothetical protein H0H87_003543 [Tephrocybe sp. NHM501043]|nr:hypothetical protein H0H87_003543 [Tephrocybe sp. NHM501043]
MLSHLPPHHPPHLLIPKYHYTDPLLARPKPLHPAFFPQTCPDGLSPIQPDSPATVEDDLPSPHSPHPRSATYDYADRSSASFDSPISSAEMYDSSLQPHSYAATSQYPSDSSAQPNYEFIDSDGTVRGQFDRPYLSESPSPVDPPPSSSFSAQGSATASTDRRSSLILPSFLPPDRYNSSPDIETDRYPRTVKYSEAAAPHFTGPSLDQRRMSEPAILAAPNPYQCGAETPHRVHTQSNYSASSLSVPRSSAYVHSLHRGASMSSLRDARHSHLDYPTHAHPPYPGWKDDSHHRHHLDAYHGDDGFDGPISPLQPDFSGGLASRGPGGPYSPTGENLYGTSPPGTGTSTSSLGPLSPMVDSFPHKDDINARDTSSKTYSFVALPGNSVKKRPRRRYDEIERLYQCSWPDCNKAYGTLNHLNAHVTMQKHGAKRQPNEFKELRKQWRKAKKSNSPGPARRASLSLRHDSREYSSRRLESQSESSAPLYTRQPAYQSSGLPSSGPSALSQHRERTLFPGESGRYMVDDRDDHLSAYDAQVRQRYSGAAPWQGASRANNPHHQYISSSLPSQTSFSDSLTADSRVSQLQRRSSQPSFDASVGRLPPDSTLLTPLPGYHQPGLLPPLQEGENQDVPYSAGTTYNLFNEGHEGRPQAGHGSLGDTEEDY